MVALDGTRVTGLYRQRLPVTFACSCARTGAGVCTALDCESLSMRPLDTFTPSRANRKRKLDGDIERARASGRCFLLAWRAP